MAPLFTNFRKWADIPPEERSKGGYWQSVLDAKGGKKNCVAACYIENSDPARYRPCTRTPAPGETVCWSHGGKPKGKLPAPELHSFRVIAVEQQVRHLDVKVKAKTRDQALLLAGQNPKWTPWKITVKRVRVALVVTPKHGPVDVEGEATDSLGGKKG